MSNLTEKETLYKVHWRSRFTNTCGSGSKAYPREIAQQIADEANDMPELREIRHWIEPSLE